MQPYPHTFTSKLKAKNCVEHDDVTFEIDTEASDAEVISFPISTLSLEYNKHGAEVIRLRISKLSLEYDTHGAGYGDT